MKAAVVFGTPGGPIHLDVVENAAKEGMVRPKRWRVSAVHGITPLPIAPGGSGEVGNLAITSCEVVDDGAPDGTHPYGGIAKDERRLPEAVAHAVELELRRLWDAGGSDKLQLESIGFKTRPTLMWPPSGRPSKSSSLIAVEVRDALQNPRADDEKLFNKARDMRILQRPPNARAFTPEGQALLDLIDAAKLALAGAADTVLLLPFPPDVIEAAISDST
jgi:hypothetical protein